MSSTDTPALSMGDFNYIELTDNQISAKSLCFGMEEFNRKYLHGMTRGDTLCLELGYVEYPAVGSGVYHHLGFTGTGNFKPHRAEVAAKLETVIEFGLDSDFAFCQYKNDPYFAKGGPSTWAGGVINYATIQLSCGAVQCVFVAAASGDHGLIGKQVAQTAVNNAGLMWCMREGLLDRQRIAGAN